MSLLKLIKGLTVLGVAIPLMTNGSMNKSTNENKIMGAGHKNVPPGLSEGTDKADFYHLSEGADIYPYDWLMVLKSKTTSKKGSGDSTLFSNILQNISSNKSDSLFLENLNEKFGVIEIPQDKYSTELKTKISKNGATEEERHYLMPFVGLTATWSDKDPKNSDAFMEDTPDKDNNILAVDSNKKNSPLYQLVVDRNGKTVRSIRMVGTNCALCHTNEIKAGSNFASTLRIDGAPNLLDIRSYFRDMMASTISLFTKEEKMQDFLDDLHVKNSKQKAKTLVDNFNIKLGWATSTFKNNNLYQNLANLTDIEKLSTLITLFKFKEGNNSNVYKGDAVIAESLEELLRVTYNIGEGENIGELEDRMKFLGKMMVGNNPLISETIAGFGRTDAFGRIGNMVLRGNNPVNLTSEVSYPWIWGIESRSMVHYNANTNSVVLRNMGQSLGLGAVIRKDGTPTSNVYNLNRLELLVHKIKFPQWQEIFKKVSIFDSNFKVKDDKIVKGRQIYMNSCAQCHESNNLVGPNNDYKLRDYKVLQFQTNLNDLETRKKAENGDYYEGDTDPMTAINATKPIYNEERQVYEKFQDVIYRNVSGLKAKFFDQYHYSEEERKKYAFESLRGSEFFRDTLFGFSLGDEKNAGVNYGAIKENSGYVAKSLAGVWATAPYLHNGSVPTMLDLLKPANQRPTSFNIKNRDFDPQTLGYKGYDRQNKPCAEDEKNTCFNTMLIGNRNTGHEYGTDLTKDEKLSLIEYLKVLAPDIEYSWEYGSRNDKNEPN